MSIGGGPALQFVDQHGTDRQCVLAVGERVTIGRSPEATISLPGDSSVSRLHAVIEWLDTHWTIVDDGLSRNGTFINGERITGRRPLRSGDKIRIGGVVLTFRDVRPHTGEITNVSPQIPTRASLSDAQLKVLVALCRPYRAGSPYAVPASNQEIADELFISAETVKTHLKSLFAKFGFDQSQIPNKRVRLVERAMLGGVVTARDL